MANVMSMKNVRNNPSRNGFDLSKRNLFTSKCGELLPVYTKEVLPGDSFEIDVKWLTRTAPVQTAAFTRIREYFDFFFVPTNLLWDKFGQFVAQTNDVGQAASIGTKAILGDTHPYMTRSGIHQYLSYMLDTPAQGKDTNIFDFSRGVLSCKLLEYLGYGRFFDPTKTISSTDATVGLIPYVIDTALNPFPLLAYQKIYQDYFRNSQWEDSAPWTCNLNYMNPSTSTSSMLIDVGAIGSGASSTSSQPTMFDLKYANWNKDYFFGLLPNSQYGDAASVFNMSDYFYIDRKWGNESFDLVQAGQNVTITNVTNNPDGTKGATLSPNNLGNFTIQPRSAVSILALRQAEALQKWKEVTQASQKDYKAQMEAHFGVTMSDAYSNRCKFIDGIVQTLDISEQPNTNITGDNTATIAGKGVGTGTGKINFKSDVHGYVMCIYHAVPLMDYSITGIQRQNLKTVVTDYAIPEFDKTGMVQVPLVELTNTPVDGVTYDENNLLGYAPRYVDYKTDFDVVNGNFVWSDDSWVAAFDNSYIEDYLKQGGSQTIFNSKINLNYVFFKVNPSILDKIFGVNVDTKVTTDQFKTNVFFDVKSTRNLDRNGLPY